MNGKLMGIVVVMVLAFGFMHFRYSKLNARLQHQAAAQKSRQADAKFERLDFSAAAMGSELMQAANENCNTQLANFSALALTPNQAEDFCRCLAVHVVTHVYPLVPETCRNAGRLDFSEPACAAIDRKKSHQPADRTKLIAKECGAWAKAGVPAYPESPPAAPAPSLSPPESF